MVEQEFETDEKKIEKALKPYDIGIWRMKPNPISRIESFASILSATVWARLNR